MALVALLVSVLSKGGTEQLKKNETETFAWVSFLKFALLQMIEPGKPKIALYVSTKPTRTAMNLHSRLNKPWRQVPGASGYQPQKNKRLHAHSGLSFLQLLRPPLVNGSFGQDTETCNQKTHGNHTPPVAARRCFLGPPVERLE